MKRVFISIDMEGISGLANWKEPRDVMSKMMLGDLMAAIEGAFDGGADRILVADSHSYGMNIPPHELPRNVELVRGYPRKYYMMAGLDGDFDVVFFIGYHAPAGYLHGQMDHTYSSFSIFRVRVNGEVFGEAELNALYAAELGVPVGLITGDSALMEFSKPNFPETVRFVVTKEGMSRFSARLYPVEEVHEKIREQARETVNASKSLKLFDKLDPDGGYELEIELNDTLKADLIEVMPGFERIDGRRLMYRASTAADVLRVVHASAIMGAYARLLSG